MPRRSHTVGSAIWAVAFAAYILFGGMAVGVAETISLVVALVAGAGIFLYVRSFGEDRPGKP